MMQLVGEFDPRYLAQLLWAPDRRPALIGPEGFGEFVGQRCPPERIAEVASRITPEPVVPYETPIQVTDERFGRVPRYYVECLQHRAVPLALQRKIQSATPFRKVYSLDTDHLPLFSAPEELAACLDSIGQED